MNLNISVGKVLRNLKFDFFVYRLEEKRGIMT